MAEHILKDTHNPKLNILDCDTHTLYGQLLVTVKVAASAAAARRTTTTSGRRWTEAISFTFW